MKTFFFFFLVLIFLIGVVNAQEEDAKYNFGSAQGAKELTISPGSEATTKLFFYNIYGNRITHITLEVGEAPKNWDVSIEPALHETDVVVSGIPTTVEENLFVEPGTDVAESIPDDVLEGIEYISSPVGFVGAKPVLITIKVPEDAKLGTVAKISIDGVASWLGQTGTAAITQGRSFEYTVTVASSEFSEIILEEAPQREEEKEEAVVVEKAEEEIEEERVSLAEPEIQVIEKVVEKEVQVGVSTTTFVGVVIVLLIVIAGLLIFFVIKKK